MTATVQRATSPPLIFVHRGPRLPRYAVPSLRAACARSGHRVVLLTDAFVPADIDASVEVIAIGDWYDDAPFAEFRTRSSLEEGFRDGFWFHAAERFFLMLQACDRFGWPTALHAELDVLLAPLGGLTERLDRAGAGVFIPRDDPGRAIASLIYVNELDALRRMCDALTADAAHGHEMRLLARFLDASPEHAYALPTDAVFARRPFRRRQRWDSLRPEEVGGIIDAAALGQWLLGIDPRNTAGPVENRYRNKRIRHDPSRLRFGVDRSTGDMSCGREGETPHRLFALHVHSKALDLATDTERLGRIMTRCNEGRASVISSG